LFNTASVSVDEFIREELDLARQTRRDFSNKLQFAQSERVLYDYTRDDQEELQMISQMEGADSLKSTIFAARNHKGWKDFIKCGYKFAQPSPNKTKRVQRCLLVGKAIDAFEDVPVQQSGSQFMQNSWH
jgi:hypothetical protein